MRALATLFALACLSLLPPVRAITPQPQTLRVLFVGNSLIYTQQLPATLSALARSQGSDIVAVSFVAPGGRIDERWRDGHVARALQDGRWDALVIQEQGGLLACLAQDATQRTADCRASEQAHRKLAALARERDVRVWLLGTWSADASGQSELDRQTRQLASRLSAGFIATGPTLRDYAREHGERAVFPDGMHPSLPATLMTAARVYRALTGTAPRAADVTIDFPLLAATSTPAADTPLERQAPHASDTPVVRIEAEAMAPLLRAAAR